MHAHVYQYYCSIYSSNPSTSGLELACNCKPLPPLNWSHCGSGHTGRHTCTCTGLAILSAFTLIQALVDVIAGSTDPDPAGVRTGCADGVTAAAASATRCHALDVLHHTVWVNVFSVFHCVASPFHSFVTTLYCDGIQLQLRVCIWGLCIRG